MRNPIDASQHQRPYRNEVWNPVHHLARIFGQRNLTELFRSGIAELFDFDACKNEDTGAPDFMKSVNAGHVDGWILPESILRLTNQVVAFAKFGRAGRTNLGARRLLPGLDSVRAHRALADSRIQRSPFVLRRAEWARRHAVAAPDAFPHVVYDGSFLRFVEGSYRADRSACRILTVHAQSPHEFVAVGEDRCELMGGGNFLSGNRIVVGEIVLCRTGLFTLLTTYTKSRII